MASTKEKEIYKVKALHEAFYSGGDIKVTTDGQQILCHCETAVKVVNISDSKVVKQFGSKENGNQDINSCDTILAFELSSDNELLITSHKSSLLCLWNFHECNLIKQWKSIHRGAVVKLALTSENFILATGGTDSSVRLWDLQLNACTQNLLGGQGVYSLLKMYKYKGTSLVFGAADDYTIRGWKLNNGKLIVSMSGHFSQVTDLEFHEEQGYAVSVGRDKVMILWKTLSGENIRTIPLYEGVESVVRITSSSTFQIVNQELSPDGFYVVTIGQKGALRLWDVLSSRELYRQENSPIDEATDGLSATNLIYNEAISSFLISTFDHNIIIMCSKTFNCTKQLVGFPDEIVSIALVGHCESHLAVATNSKNITLYRRKDMSCCVLRGHSGFVLSLAVSSCKKDLFVSSSKDHSVKVWLLNHNESLLGATCIATATRHTSDVLSVALTHLTSQYCVTVSSDTTMKLWSLPENFTTTDTLVVKQTVKAHEKDVNCVSISPNDRVIASGSMDKSIKLWSLPDLNCLGTLSGHRRGVWSCRFSPVDQVLVTSSSDMTIKLWSLGDLSCLKTLEGHDSAILCCEFLSQGQQLISGGADGLIKLWSIKSSENVSTFDSHIGKIWTLAVSSDETIVFSGGNDSKLIEWEDCTEAAKEEKMKQLQEKVLQDQQLSNLIQKDCLLEAIKLAISLNRPNTVYTIFQDILEKDGTTKDADSSKISQALSGLGNQEKIALLDFSAHWNTNAKRCAIAQVVMSSLLCDVSIGNVSPQQSVLEAFIPYSERHFTRLSLLYQDLHFIRYAKQKINPVSVTNSI